MGLDSFCSQFLNWSKKSATFVNSSFHLLTATLMYCSSSIFNKIEINMFKISEERLLWVSLVRSVFYDFSWCSTHTRFNNTCRNPEATIRWLLLANRRQSCSLLFSLVSKISCSRLLIKVPMQRNLILKLSHFLYFELWRHKYELR